MALDKGIPITIGRRLKDHSQNDVLEKVRFSI